MSLPRWTVYPALALIAIFLITALPKRHPEELLPAPGSDVVLPEPRFSRVVVLGIDGLDPELLQETIERYPDRTRNLQRIIAEGGLNSLATSNPPQSPVAWSNFITGLNPGGHGIFDFIHRDLVHRNPSPSTTKSGKAKYVPLPGKWKFPLPGDTSSNRTGKAFWSILADHGVPADVWRMPINFPVEPAQGVSFPGMMTPALDSAYGQYVVYAEDPPVKTELSGGKIVEVRFFGNSCSTSLGGPPNAFQDGDPQAVVELKIILDDDRHGAVVQAGAESLVLEPGEWSDFMRVTFGMLPMGVGSVSGIVRFYLRSMEPFELYVSPVNIDPVAPIAPVSEPPSASADLVDGIGLYYTQGMAEEVNGLKDEVLTPPEFMQQAELVYDQRLRMMDYALDHYLEDDEGGFFFFYFSTVDLCCHMMWRHHDEDHPAHDASFASEGSEDWSKREGSHWKDVVYDLYLRMDPVLGRVRERVGKDTHVIVMSDHGFAPYRRVFSLNTWLHENGYLVLKDGLDKEKASGDSEFGLVVLSDAVDWTRTRAYGMGFNGLYLNLKGREADDPETTDVDESGIVSPGTEAGELLRELKRKLEALIDPKNGGRIITDAAIASEIYSGERLSEAPDMLVGYDAGYGNSDASSTGRVPHNLLMDNLGGTFNGNHLMDPAVVRGTLLSSRPVPAGDFGLEDLTVEILGHYGISPGPGMDGRRIFDN